MSDVRPFPTVPIVGQPLHVLGWSLLVYVSCRYCTPPSFVPLMVKQGPLGRVSDLGICPGCGRAMHAAQMTMNAQNQLEFGISLAESMPTPAGTAS